VLVAGGTVDAPIGRHPTQRTRMAVVDQGKPAVSHYRVAERFRAHTLVRVTLESGRTHQIRVHMAHLRYPVLGDPVYGGRLKLPPDSAPELVNMLRTFRRQALHAVGLGLIHPGTGEAMHWSSPLPADMQALIAALAADARAHAGGGGGVHD
jgi:23S rRNA pseudouridine1911/1915/1917 synthase